LSKAISPFSSVRAKTAKTAVAAQRSAKAEPIQGNIRQPKPKERAAAPRALPTLNADRFSVEARCGPSIAFFTTPRL
jgi:hypothetical protein